MSQNLRMADCGSCLSAVLASSIRIILRSTDFRHRCTSSKSLPTTRSTTRRTGCGCHRDPKSRDRLHGAELRRPGEGALPLYARRPGPRLEGGRQRPPGAILYLAGQSQLRKEMETVLVRLKERDSKSKVLSPVALMPAEARTPDRDRPPSR